MAVSQGTPPSSVTGAERRATLEQALARAGSPEDKLRAALQLVDHVVRSTPEDALTPGSPACKDLLHLLNVFFFHLESAGPDASRRLSVAPDLGLELLRALRRDLQAGKDFSAVEAPPSEESEDPEEGQGRWLAFFRNLVLLGIFTTLAALLVAWFNREGGDPLPGISLAVRLDPNAPEGGRKLDGKAEGAGGGGGEAGGGVDTQGMVSISKGPVIRHRVDAATGRVEEEVLTVDPFWIDRKAAVAGTLPRTGLTAMEVGRSCRGQGKRLCTDLEWQRACGGPQKVRFAHGDVLQASCLATSEKGRDDPSCVSGYGVHGMSDGRGEWVTATRSAGAAALVADYAGDAGTTTPPCGAPASRPGDQASPNIGFRCCLSKEE